MLADIAQLDIISPKRNARAQSGWEGFFPYYAGYPEEFAERILRSAKLDDGARVLDPWNGSGTTTYTASRFGLPSVGIDLNPAMVIIARARSLSPNERDALIPLGNEILARATCDSTPADKYDPLRSWFGPATATWLRNMERASRHLLLGEQTRCGGQNLKNISPIASTFYVALFAICRGITKAFKSTNPTWTKMPATGQRKASATSDKLAQRFRCVLSDMSTALALRAANYHELAATELFVADTATLGLAASSVDLVLTSPPYCTRLDYTAATRLELALLSPLLESPVEELSRQMLGSVRVPVQEIEVNDAWGETCKTFLHAVQSHPSKASSGYYYRTHIDYFSKIYESISSISKSIKVGGVMIMVVQDSHYKEVHNDLATTITEMSINHSLELKRRENFRIRNFLAQRHPHVRNYRVDVHSSEAVLCFERV
jgi:hypothetical protein